MYHNVEDESRAMPAIDLPPSFFARDQVEVPESVATARVWRGARVLSLRGESVERI